MAYDYLGLVNDVNRRLNEVELTSSNFATATGEYSMIKQPKWSRTGCKTFSQISSKLCYSLS